jgi:hypothetical protein
MWIGQPSSRSFERGKQMNASRIGSLLIALGAVTLVACGSPRGGSQVAMVTPLTVGPPPIYALLGYRNELSLTSDQVTALDSIAQTAQEENRTLVEELQATSRERARQPGFFELTAEGEAVLERIRANQRRAVDGVADLLSEEQQATVCRLFQPGRRNPSARQPPAARAAADTAQARRGPQGPPGWHWCEERPAAESAAAEVG